MKTRMILFMIGFVIVLVGCTSRSPAAPNFFPMLTPTNNLLRENLTQLPSAQPSGDSIQTINTPDFTGLTPPPAGTNPFVTLAEQDLAQRLKVDVDQITFLKITDIDWQDITQGCASTPGQTLTKGKLSGYRIWLEVNGKDYVYHVGLDGKIFLCPD